MPRQRGLDEFLDSEAGTVESPVDVTYRFVPSPCPCSECGEKVSRLWRDDGRYVCVTCKEW